MTPTEQLVAQLKAEIGYAKERRFQKGVNIRAIKRELHGLIGRRK